MASFHILAVLGRGFYGKVMLCKRINTTKLYAIKSVHKSNLLTNGKVQMIFDERAILATMKHPFIVGLAFTFQTASKIYIGMEYLPGGELYKHMRSRRCLKADEVRLLTPQIALALLHLHENGVLYRDLKPENILIDASGYLRLIDFGLSKLFEKGQPLTSRTFCGTPRYLAPEIVLGQQYGKEADWWAFGVVLYQLLVGIVPFSGSTELKVFELIKTAEPTYRPTMDPVAVDLIKGLLIKDPKQRLGGADVLKHPFYAGVDFQAILRREVEMVSKPTLVNGIGQMDGDGDEMAAESSAEDVETDKFEGFSFADVEMLLSDSQMLEGVGPSE
jgi:serine/threonine protein kinase